MGYEEKNKRVLMRKKLVFVFSPLFFIPKHFEYVADKHFFFLIIKKNLNIWETNRK